jgi:hypothetical protein
MGPVALMQPVRASVKKGASSGKGRIREVINFLNDFNAMTQSQGRCGILVTER